MKSKLKNKNYKMKKYPSVSILIPTYNRASLLDKAVKSALEQDYPNLTVIVSDDASTDNTSNIIAKYLKDARLKYYRNDENLGAVKNVRKIIYEYTNSDWFLLTADDEYLTDISYISKCMSLTDKYENLVLISGNVELHFKESGKIHRQTMTRPECVSGKWFFLNWNDYNYPPAPSSIIKTNVFKNFDNLFKNGITDDFEAYLMLCLSGDIGFCKDIAGVFTVHCSNEGIGKLNADNIINSLYCIENPYNYAKNRQVFSKELIENWRKKMIANFLKGRIEQLTTWNNDEKEANRLKKRIKKEFPFVLNNFYLQLFVDKGKSFNEKDSIKQSYNNEESIYIFDLSGYKNIYQIRLDPLNESVVISLGNCYLISKSGEKYKLKIKSHNGELFENMFYFGHNDPQIIFYPETNEKGLDFIKEAIFEIKYHFIEDYI